MIRPLCQTDLIAGALRYAKVEHLRAAAAGFRARYGVAYFSELLDAHRAVGLSCPMAASPSMASLTPVKEKEVWLLADEMGTGVADATYAVLDCYVRRLGVTSFNLAAYLPPLAPAAEDWTGFPAIVRIVDRGPLNDRTSDIGAMELFTSSVVSSDPFELIEALRGVMNDE